MSIRNIIMLLAGISVIALMETTACTQIVAPISKTPISSPASSASTATPTSPQTTSGTVSRELCRGGDRVIILLVDTRLLNGISTGLEQFASDLCKDGYTVIQRLSDFKNPSEVRSYLVQMYTQTKGQLAGAIAFGDLPHAYQLVTEKSTNPSIPSLTEETISFQYYTDLNGTFGASPSYKSPGKHEYSYDTHTGDLNWEIWFGLLPLYKGDISKTIESINRYFSKNHAYRSGQSNISRGFIEINEHYKSTSTDQDAQYLSYLRAGTYAWLPFSKGNNAHLYFDTKTPGLGLNDGYQALTEGFADFTVQDAHGWYTSSGKLTVDLVENKPVSTVFFWSNGCAVGNIDYPGNFLTSILYSATSSVLVAKGTTNESGGMGNNIKGFFGANIASAMSGHMSIGDAILSHINVPLVSPYSDNREFLFATTVILGDPTLKLCW